MKLEIVLFVSLCLVGVRGETEPGERDYQPGDPEFIPNVGDLESDVAPQSQPEGNYNVVREKGVLVLNRDTFAHVVIPKDLILVEFYAPWCGHCKTLKPEYQKAAAILEKDGLSLAMVDATKESELAKEYMVQGFPTLILFRKGVKIETYEGERKADAIVEYMQRQNDPNWKPPPASTIVLDGDNFAKTVKDAELILVAFVAPWCKHCKQLEPEFEGAAKELKSWGIVLAKVDGTAEKEIADQYGIKGWPMLKIFRKGRMYDYKGPREKDNIIAYMKQQGKSPSQEKTTRLGLQNNMDRLDATVVGFFKGKSDLYDEFIVAANEMRETFRFMHTFKPDLAKHYKMPEEETIAVVQPEIFHSPYENSTYTFSKKSATYKEIIAFIKKSSVPLVGQRTKKNLFKYTDRPLIVVYYDVNYINHEYIEDTQFVRKKILDVAKDYVGSNLKFAISNEEEFTDELEFLGLSDSGENINVGAFSEKQKFKMDPSEEFDAQVLIGFVEMLKNGKVKPYLKSLPIPKVQTEPVKTLVANNFEDEVMKVKKDAVIFFHAPWCGHCKKFSPIYKKLATKMIETNENLIFGKMDATENDVPYQFPQLKGYPSIFFLSAYEKYDPVNYQGDRSYKSLKDWVNRHSSIFLTEEERTGKSNLEDDQEDLDASKENNKDEL